MVVYRMLEHVEMVSDNPMDTIIVERGTTASFSCVLSPIEMLPFTFFSWNLDETDAVRTYSNKVTYNFDKTGHFWVSVVANNVVSTILSRALFIKVCAIIIVLSTYIKYAEFYLNKNRAFNIKCLFSDVTL